MDNKFLQKALNQIFDGQLLKVNGSYEELKEDGIIGIKSQIAIYGGKNFKNGQMIESIGAINLLKDTFQTLAYDWDSDFNLIGVRMDDVYTDGFTDILIIYIHGTLLAFPFSTKPGLWSVYNNKNKSVDGVKGVLVLKEGQYRDTYNLQGAWWSGLPFLWQRKPIQCFRDSKGGKTIDRSVIQNDVAFFKKFGYYFQANIHSWVGWTAKVLSWWHWLNGKQGGSITEGCQVADATAWGVIVPHIRKGDADGWLTYTLLHKKEILLVL